MKIEDGTVVFKSNPYFFKLERDGLKPNTERLLTFLETKEAKVDIENPKETIKKIRIECTVKLNGDDFELFTRTLTSIEQIGELCGYYLFVFSWRHEG